MASRPDGFSDFYRFINPHGPLGFRGLCMIPIRAAGLAAASLAPEIFHAFTFRLFRRLRTRFPALILRRPPDAQTSSPAGFFRAGCPQKPHVPAKSPPCSLQPRLDSLERERVARLSSEISQPFSLAFVGQNRLEMLPRGKKGELQERWS